MKHIAVFCGGQVSYSDDLMSIAERLGALLAKNDWTIVYGAGSYGMMGALARGAIKENGKLIGVVPEGIFPEDEKGSNHWTELIKTSTLHKRKEIMVEMSDAFITLPGGIGTLDEFFEVWALSKLGYHTKPMGILNAHGYFDHLIKLLEFFTQENHAPSTDSSLEPVVEECLVRLVEKLTLKEICKTNEH